MTTPILLPANRESRVKALRSMANLGFLNVWEGAIRSGKTVFALSAFALYVEQSPETEFLLSGRTVSTAEKNLIFGDFGLLSLLPGSTYGRVGESRAVKLTVRRGLTIVRKTIFVMGAADIRAYMALRGQSYAGWMADEINMHDKEFVSEALRRTAVSKDRVHIWTLNPDNPRHWIYTDYLDRYDAMSKEEKKALGGYHWWHFTPRDNPIMSDEQYASLCLQFPQDSYLYQRYILGLRAIAEGLVYPRDVSDLFEDFDPQETYTDPRTGKVKRLIDIRYCAIDFGQDHPTVMIFGGCVGNNKQDWRMVREYYDKGSDRTTYDYYKDFLKICDELGVDPKKICVAIDPAAKVLRTEFLNRGLDVIRAENDVLPGIAYVRTLLYSRRVRFHSSMVHLRGEFPTYAWDVAASNRGEDKPVKIDDDCVDAFRYFCYTHIRHLIG